MACCIVTDAAGQPIAKKCHYCANHKSKPKCDAKVPSRSETLTMTLKELHSMVVALKPELKEMIDRKVTAALRAI